MSQTVAQVATRALDVDFDAGMQAKAEQFVREAVLEIYSNTRLHRGDIPMNLVSISAAATTLTQSSENVYFDAIVFADNGDELAPTSFPELLALRAMEPNRTGRPLVYSAHGAGTVEALTVEIWPKADRAYQVFIAGAQSPPASELEAGDTVPLPDAWLKLPYYYARAELFALDSDPEEESAWMTKWITGCSAMRSDVQRYARANRQVPGTWAGAGSAMPTFHYPGLF